MSVTSIAAAAQAQIDSVLGAPSGDFAAVLKKAQVAGQAAAAANGGVVPAAHGSHHGHRMHSTASAVAATDSGSSGALVSGAFSNPAGDASGAATPDVSGSAQSTADALSGDLMRSMQAYMSGSIPGATLSLPA